MIFKKLPRETTTKMKIPSPSSQLLNDELYGDSALKKGDCMLVIILFN
jgi:hypothetical protein